MTRPLFDDVVEVCLARDSRFSAEAYYVVRDALDHAQKLLGGDGRRPLHVSGRQLCEALREHALEQFGPLARLLLGMWGIRSTGDIGEVVFNLIDDGAFSRSDEDERGHFEDVYDFEEAFDEPFLPASRLRRRVEPVPAPVREPEAA